MGFYSLIGPFPDEATEHAGVGVDFIPIFLEIAKGVAHGMGVFGGEHGAIVHGVAGYR